VKFLGQVFRFLLWFFLISWLFGKLLSRFAKQSDETSSGGQATPRKPKPLFRDPVCGTFVSAEISLPLELNGESLHFCSAECRDRYGAARPRAARA
jgi:YHS domain-containing protein